MLEDSRTSLYEWPFSNGSVPKTLFSRATLIRVARAF
jgi:hypothetical protein